MCLETPLSLIVTEAKEAREEDLLIGARTNPREQRRERRSSTLVHSHKMKDVQETLEAMYLLYTVRSLPLKWVNMY
jgi:hypothetical protein